MRMALLRASLLLSFVGLSVPAHAQTDFTQGAAAKSATSTMVWFKPNAFTAGYVILHYTAPSVGQQNVNMVWNATTAEWEYTIGNLPAGTVVPYSFTYQKNGGQLDSGSFS